MAKIKTQTNCPNCGQLVVVEIEQLFDTTADTQAKSRLISGKFNLINCPHCGFNGNLSTPIVYHDKEKELLLSLFPPELKVERNEQEKVIGKLINQAVENLPQEQRMGYLFSPQSSLTLQGFIERILEADGVTKEMLDEQQNKIKLIGRLVNSSEDTFAEAVKEEDELIDAEFFSLISRLAQASIQSGDQNGFQKLNELQEKLIPITTFGKQLQEQSKEVEEAAKILREAGEELTREKLLEIVIKAPNETRLSSFTSLARPGMDYEFFQMLTTQIDKSKAKEKKKLTDIREKLLKFTAEIDQQLEARLGVARQNLNSLLEVENIREALLQNLPVVDEFFLQVLNDDFVATKNSDDKEKLQKLQQIIDALQEVQQSSGVGDQKLLQELLEAKDDGAVKKILEAHSEEVTPAFVESLTGMLVQLEAGEDKETTDKVRGIYRAAVRMSMKASMKSE